MVGLARHFPLTERVESKLESIVTMFNESLFLLKYAIKDIQFNSKKNYQKLIHDVGKAN